MAEQLIILFDGQCNFCNSAVNFVIKNDPDHRFQFAALQSEAGKELLKDEPALYRNQTSFVFVENGKTFTASGAALRVCRYLKGAWPLLFGFIIVPRFLRDGIYHWISVNRYRWFGKREYCMKPSEEIRSQFLN